MRNATLFFMAAIAVAGLAMPGGAAVAGLDPDEPLPGAVSLPAAPYGTNDIYDDLETICKGWLPDWMCEVIN